MTYFEVQIDGKPGDSDFRTRVFGVMVEQLNRMVRPEVPITETTRLMDDLRLSSSMALELMLEIEEALNIQIDVENLDPEQMYTVGELSDFIAAHSIPA